MFGGSFERKGTYVEGSLKQYAWHDTSEYEHKIKYDGEITPEVESAIRQAWAKDQFFQRDSGYGKLRWSGGRNISSIDRERKVIIALEVTNLAD